MGLIDNFSQRITGAAKARRDIEMAQMFLEEHNGRPPKEVSSRFFGSLGKDVPNGTQERRTYENLAKRFIQSDPHLKAIANGAKITVVEIDLGLLARIMPGIVPLLSHEEIEALAAEHGHDRDDECDLIKAMRARRAQADQNGGN